MCQPPALSPLPSANFGAGDGTRTHDLLLGKEAFYQLNYARLCSAEGRNRTGDTRIFSPLLYQLSYLGAFRLSAFEFYLSIKALSRLQGKMFAKFFDDTLLGLVTSHPSHNFPILKQGQGGYAHDAPSHE